MTMDSIRQRKVADQIKELVSLVIDQKIKDPQKGFITITHVKVSRDLRIASIYFTVLGEDAQKEKSLAVLNRAKNFIRNEIAPSLKMRFVPELRFFVDDTMDYARKIEKLLDDIKKQEKK